MADRLNISLVPSLEASVDFGHSIGFMKYNHDEYNYYYMSSTGKDFVAFFNPFWFAQRDAMA